MVDIDALIERWRGGDERAAEALYNHHRERTFRLASSSPAIAGGTVYFCARSLVFSVMLNCPTLGDAMQKLCRYHGLSTDFVRLGLQEQGEQAYYSWEPVSADFPLQRHHSEAVLCGLVSMLRRLTDGQMRLVAIRFRHPQPADTTEHERIFRCPLSFGQSRNELVLRREDLDLPIFLANPELLQRLERFAQEMLHRLTPPESWSDRVTHRIGQALLRGDKPRLEAVARELVISSRHLQNKLKEEGTTYRALLDELRRETALDYLKKPRVPIVDVAFLLGFSEQSGFNHAFKRWTGVSPQQYRERALSSPGGNVN